MVAGIEKETGTHWLSSGQLCLATATFHWGQMRAEFFDSDRFFQGVSFGAWVNLARQPCEARVLSIMSPQTWCPVKGEH